MSRCIRKIKADRASSYAPYDNKEAGGSVGAAATEPQRSEYQPPAADVSKPV